MSISYQGIGEWCATFACSGVTEGKVVKIGSSNTAALCSAGDMFCGVARSVGHDGAACSVQLGGLVEVKYSGSTAPSVGYNELVADAVGGVAVAGDDDTGMNYLVIAVDTTAKIAVIKL